MNEHGIRPEHECFDSGHLANLDPLLDMRALHPPLQVSCVMGVTGGIRPTARNLAHMAEQVPDVPHQWGVIGISREQWMLVAAALALGGNVRVGLEDNFYLPDGTMARSNGDLVAKARAMARGRRPARGHGRRGAPAARHAEASGRLSALEGIRVLDLSRLLPGGFCSLLLADFGADVIKVEDTGMGDYVRWAAPRHEGAEASAGGAMFLALNRGKRSVRIDLKTDGGREVLLRLARDADVVLESFRPGVMDRLGVGYERLREENPRLVYCAITGYGQDGPFAARAGHDTNYLARIGMLDLTGDPDGPPVQAGGQIADLGGGALMAAFGILAALRERDRSGEGQLVDISMTDGALSWLAMDAARVLAGGDAAGPRPSRARRRVALLPAVPVRRRLGRARCARAEVLARVVRAESVARTSSSASSSRSARTYTATSRPCSPAARAPSGRRSTTSTTAAWSRCSRSTRRSSPSSCGRAAWSSRSSSPARGRCGCSARRSSSRARPRDPDASRRPAARRRHRRGPGRGRLHGRAGHGAEGVGRGRGPGGRG